MNQREIKFRAWDKERSIMLEGRDDAMVGLVFGPEDGWLSFGAPQLEIMQYTGLKDKNGKEIYEGDIVCEWNGEKSVVEWSLDRCGEYGCVGWDGVGSGNYGGQKHDELEVIGNIFEHPSLLKP